MAAFNVERITEVHHWNDTLFSFKCTRDPGLRFKNGQFVMIGLEVNGKPLMRAYSIASRQMFPPLLAAATLAQFYLANRPADKISRPHAAFFISHPSAH